MGEQGLAAPVKVTVVKTPSSPVKARPAEIQQKMRVKGVYFAPDADRGFRGSGELHAEFNVNNPPMDIAVEVLFIDAGRKWGGDLITIPPFPGWSLETRVEGFDPKTVDVIIRGSAEAARRTVRITRAWGGEITLKNVPVGYYYYDHRPTTRSIHPTINALP